MTTLVTGATGFVGSAVLRRALEQGHAVRALVRPSSDRANLEGLEVEVRVGDLGDPASLARALEGVRVLFHVAAEYRLWHPRPAELYKANVEGTRNVLEAAQRAGVERVVYTSSVATVGLLPQGEADESTPVSLEDMLGHYKRSKYLAEREAERFAGQGLDVVIVNPSAPVGPRDVKPTPTGRMVLDAAAGRMPAYLDTGLNVVHVDDVARGHMQALERGRTGERYILGSQNLSLREILQEIASLTGRAPPRIRLFPAMLLPVAYAAQAWARATGGSEPRVTVDGVRLASKRMYFTCEKARRELGYQARPARDALRDAVDWLQAAGRLT